MSRKLNPAVDAVLQRHKNIPMFYQAIGLLFSVGHEAYSSLTDEQFDKQTKKVYSRNKAIEAEGCVPIMTPAFEIELMTMARELSKIDLWDILYYIKRQLPIG